MTNETNVHTLSQPAKISDTLATQQKDYDCTPCRLMGSAAFTGLGIYSYASGMSQLRQREAEILKSGSRVTMGMRRGKKDTVVPTMRHASERGKIENVG
ncbi:hypothetical protein Q7P37_009569 [Cladosporium fusiforme]